MPLCCHCLWVSNLYQQFPIVTAASVYSDLFRQWWVVSSPGKTKLKKSPAVAVAVRTVVGPVGLLKSWSITNSRLYPHSSSLPLSTDMLLLSSSSVLLSSLLWSAEMSLSPDVSALDDISAVKPKNSSSLSIALKNIANQHYMLERVRSSDFDVQIFTLNRTWGLWRCSRSEGTITIFPNW